MKSVLFALSLLVSGGAYATPQTYFSCTMDITGGYALEGQQFGIVLNTMDMSFTFIGGSADPIFPLKEIPATLMTITSGGPNNWPSEATAEYVSPTTSKKETAKIVFKVGKLGAPAVTYTTTESKDVLELQCH